MKNMVYCLLCNLLLVALFILTSCGRQSGMVAVVPAPVFMQQGSGAFVIDADTSISIDDESQRQVAQWFAGLFERPAGFVPAVHNAEEDAQIRLFDDPSLAPESYRLYVDDSNIDVFASEPSGFFYALQTVRGALPARLESDALSPDAVWEVPSMTVYDAPRFPYRGLMVDVSRYFLPKENLLELIDCMAMLKLNNLHLHLTDDNGWRLEIKKYPRLTSVGAWRADRGDTPFPDRVNQVEDEPTPVGGYYTQDDIRDIVAYAGDRHINVIPEIDMPAHSNSALATYPQYACPVVDKYIGVLPGLGGSNADIIYCAGNDDVFDFIKDIIDEVCELFPSEYIHLGGDEAWKTYWKICPHCQKRIHDEGLSDEEALQGWFMEQVNDYLRSKGRTMMGWDEVTDSAVPEGAVVFGWQGNGEAALKAAQRGHRFVLTPSELLSLIRYQGPQWFEPLSYFGNSTLKDVYEYEPVGEDWPLEYQALLQGIQGSMWTEFCYTPDDVTYQIFPRLAAVAEVAWSPAGAKDWKKFLRGVDSFVERLDSKGIAYSESMYNIQHTVTPSAGRLSVNLQCERPDVSIRYTLDGTDPDMTSPEFSGNILVNRPVVIKAATFFSDGLRAGKQLELPISWNKATGCRIFSGRPAASLLVNGVHGSLRQTDFEWCHFLDDASVVVDLGHVSYVKDVTVGTLTNYGMAFHKPASMSVWLSENGVDYVPAGYRRWTEEDIFQEGNFEENVTFSFTPKPVRYVKVNASHPGRCPDYHLRPGMVSRFCFDEIEVYGLPFADMHDAGPEQMRFGHAMSDTASINKKISEKSNKNLLRWSVFSDLDM